MKAISPSHASMFLHTSFPRTITWGENRQPSRRQPRALDLPNPSTDDLAASKPEIVCGGILAACFFYTLLHLIAQMAA